MPFEDRYEGSPYGSCVRGGSLADVLRMDDVTEHMSCRMKFVMTISTADGVDVM